MVTDAVTSHRAPGDLELVRMLLNSWQIPNDTRVPFDRFNQYADDRRLDASEADRVRALREDLRVVVEEPAAADALLNPWIDRLDFRPTIHDGVLRFGHAPGHASELLAITLDAISGGQWRRLKACPDCRWVFYDHTRNASKRWCLMNAGGPEGRGCGTIAKVRRHRERAKLGGSES